MPDITRDDAAIYGPAPQQPVAQPAAQGTLQVPETTVVGNPISPTAAAMIGPPDQVPATSPLSTSEFNKQQIGSAEERKYLTAQQAEITARGGEKEADIHDRAAAEDLQRQTEARAALQKAMADADARDAALRKQIQQAAAEKPLTASDAWNQRSTGSKIMAGIGIILGGMGGGLARTGRNPAMDVINNAINSDVDASREHIANNWKAISEQHGLDDTAFNREMHRQVWENNYRTGSLERVKMELASNAARTTSAATRQNALLGIQDLTDAQAKIRNHMYVLGQQASMANQARIRKLLDEKNKDIMELVKEKGVSPDEAVRFVEDQDKYHELKFLGFNQAGAQLPLLRTQAAVEIEKLKGYGYSPEDAANKVLSNPTYAPLTKVRGPIVPEGPKPGGETDEQKNNRTVYVDQPVMGPSGKPLLGATGQPVTAKQPVLAPNKESADAFHNYDESAPVVAKLYKDMRDAWERGDPGGYANARGNLIEVLPKYYGFNRGPSVAQVKDTFGEAIPDYAHWYPGGGGVHGETGIGSLERQARVTKALDQLGETLNKQSDTMRSQLGLPPSTDQLPVNPTTIGGGTFFSGAAQQLGRNTPFGSTLPQQPNFKPKIDFTPTVTAPVVQRPKE
jgi:hypothetical protein